MPNWVFNYVTIEGSKEDIKRVKEQLNAPFSSQKRDWQTEEITTTDYNNPVFSFWNIIRPTEDKWAEYYEPHGWMGGKATGQSMWNWYNFNTREWGTKWDVALEDGEDAENRLIFESDTKLMYYFDTAWSPPISGLNHLSKQYPNLNISNEWEEEQGFGATSVHKNGQDTEVDGYDWKCSHCEYHYCGDPSKLIYDEDCGENICPKCEPDRYSKKKKKKAEVGA